MNADIGGILLPATVLGSDWFQALAAFVAINTLVYAGLSPGQADPTAPRVSAERSRRTFGGGRACSREAVAGRC